MRPTESCGTLSRTSGAVEEDVERSEEEEVVALLFVDAVPVPVAALAPDDVVGGVVRTLEAGIVPLEGGEVGGGIPAEDDAAWAKTPGAIRSKRLRNRANRLQRDAIAEDRTRLDRK
jgi:hypothetical protein